MSLIRLRNLTLSFGGPLLLDHASLNIDSKERICLIGRNGTGKSTLLKIIMGQIQADDGAYERDAGLRISYLLQEVPDHLENNVFDVVAAGAGNQGQLLIHYHQLSHQIAEQPELLTELEIVQDKLERHDGWQLKQQTDAILSRLGLEAETAFSSLSGGLKRRVLLARALAGKPDLLLLDEPTNHLDIDAIKWMEDFLLSFKGTLLFISHDRSLLQTLSTRIIELDRGQLFSYPCNYQDYIERKQAALAAEEKQNAEFDKKLAQEERWIRQGIKARRTRNEGRVRALESLRETRQQRRQQTGKVKLEQQQVDYAGKRVIEAKNIHYQYDDKPIINNFSTTIIRGDRVGIIGANGSGKTTLLRLLLGQLEPQQGQINLGTNLNIAYFDQHRHQLDIEKSVQDNISSSQMITINDKPRHVISYLQDFLFPPDKIRSPVKALSGGERNRLLLAKLFANPANLLVMDEPTNDLDIETLELLEERLLEYSGTLLLVSHDRTFIDNTVTNTLVFEQGQLNEYIGGYQDWLRQRPQITETTATTKTNKAAPTKAPPQRKLSYREQQELTQLPQRLEALEQEQEDLHNAMNDASFYQQDKANIHAANQRLEQIATELEQAYQRWEELEN